MKDLKHRRWMYAKFVLFLLLGVMSGALLLLDRFDFRHALFLALAVWSMCRAYYFVFYVIEHYIDPSFKFSGLGSFVRYLLRKRG